MLTIILCLILLSSSASGKIKFKADCDYICFILSLGTLLYQMNETNFFCPSEDVAFWCSGPENLDWMINIPNGFSFSTYFDRRFNRLGQIRQEHLEITTVFVSVEFINSSHIGSIARFNNAALLNGTLIRCNQENILFKPIVAGKSPIFY